MTHAESGLRHLGISADDAVLFERLASRVLGTDGSLRARAETLAVQRARSVRAVAARHLRRPADPARPRGRRRGRAAGAPGAAGAGVLAAQGAQRRRRDRQRASGRAIWTRCRRSSRRSSKTGRGARGSIGRAARTCCAPTGWAGPSASCSRPWRARSSAATEATCGRSSIGPTRSEPPAVPARAGAAEPRRDAADRAVAAADDVRQRSRRLHR